MELIKKYLDDLEDDLRCPVCFELPTDFVHMCVQGHHVCKNCGVLYLNNTPDCPTCRSTFNGTSNYLIKNICANIHEIKKLLPKTEFYDSHDHTRTDDNVSKSQVKTLSNRKLIPQKKYSCQIKFCDEKLQKNKILHHVRRYHEINFIEEVNKPEIFTYRWIIKYTLDKIFDRAIHVSGMGLFFFKIQIHTNGHMYGSIQMVNPANKAKRLNYTLNLTCENRSLRYEGKIDSCQVVGGYDLQEKMSFFINNAQLSILLKTEEIFNCHLMLYRRQNRCKLPLIDEHVEDCTNYVLDDVGSILKNVLHIGGVIFFYDPNRFCMIMVIIIYIVFFFLFRSSS